MRKLICLLSLLLTISSARADICDDLSQLLDSNLPKILAGIDRATQATNAEELAAALIQVADALELLKTRFTSSLELKAITQGNEDTWPKNCVAISRRAEILIAEIEAAGNKLEKYFDKYTTDPAVSAANERIKKALQGS